MPTRLSEYATRFLVQFFIRRSIYIHSFLAFDIHPEPDIKVPALVWVQGNGLCLVGRLWKSRLGRLSRRWEVQLPI